MSQSLSNYVAVMYTSTDCAPATPTAAPGFASPRGEPARESLDDQFRSWHAAATRGGARRALDAAPVAARASEADPPRVTELDSQFSQWLASSPGQSADSSQWTPPDRPAAALPAHKVHVDGSTGDSCTSAAGSPATMTASSRARVRRALDYNASAYA